MTETPYRTALIVGVGGGLSASVARTFAKAGMKIALAARRVADLAALAKEVGGEAFACDATKRGDVVRLFGEVERAYGAPDVVVYNASYRTRGAFIELDPAEVEKTLAVSVFGGFLVAQEAAKRMLPHKHGAILFTGASASVKGYAQSAPFAMGKFALRGTRPEHGARIVAAGYPRCPYRDRWRHSQCHVAPIRRTSLTACSIPTPSRKPTCDLLQQRRSAWAWEIELRPWVERF